MVVNKFLKITYPIVRCAHPAASCGALRRFARKCSFSAHQKCRGLFEYFETELLTLPKSSLPATGYNSGSLSRMYKRENYPFLYKTQAGIKKKKKSEFFPLFVQITISTMLIDQILKYVIVATTPRLNFGFLSLDVARNTGAGFGLLQGKTVLLSIISFIVALGIILSYKKIPLERNVQILFALFLGGVLGNLIDRLARGHVIDFINFSFWPSFNIADAAISLAAVGLIKYILKK